ncbi:Sacsin [Holothuria leucospilota]|uniref:Sacsin n=1 Tax=Holothuria leucospilota TaxID=206669 RepID=A0A9Q0YPR1_HOLLE|nr:Sacsin [Holothuria leucospilota]
MRDGREKPGKEMSGNTSNRRKRRHSKTRPGVSGDTTDDRHGKRIKGNFELIQNAEDAGASEIRFLYDQNQYGTESLLQDELADFQVRQVFVSIT